MICRKLNLNRFEKNNSQFHKIIFTQLVLESNAKYWSCVLGTRNLKTAINSLKTFPVRFIFQTKKTPTLMLM